MQINGFNQAYQGIQTGFTQLNQTSEKIADPNQTDKAEALIEQLTAKNLVETNVKSMKAADERIGTLLDISA